MEEKFQRARILENIERYLKFEGVAFNDELMVKIHTMLIEAKNALKPTNSNNTFNFFIDLLHRKIDFTSDKSVLKEDFYNVLVNKIIELIAKEENIEKRITLSNILDRFKTDGYKIEFFNYANKMDSVDEDVEFDKMTQFEKDLKFVISLINESVPDQNCEMQYVDGGGVDWNSRDYFGSKK